MDNDGLHTRWLSRDGYVKTSLLIGSETRRTSRATTMRGQRLRSMGRRLVIFCATAVVDLATHGETAVPTLAAKTMPRYPACENGYGSRKQCDTGRRTRQA